MIKDKVAVGIIRTTHGVKGYLKVRPLSGETEHFFHMKEVFLNKKNTPVDTMQVYTIEDVKPQGHEIIIKFHGIDNPESGKRLSNWEIWVKRAMAAPLADGEYYISDLHGAKLMLRGEVTGTIIAVSETTAVDLLEVDTPQGIRIIPFNDQFIGQVDVLAKTIELKAEWLLE